MTGKVTGTRIRVVADSGFQKQEMTRTRVVRTDEHWTSEDDTCDESTLWFSVFILPYGA